jgi:hypothetical protein
MGKTLRGESVNVRELVLTRSMCQKENLTAALVPCRCALESQLSRRHGQTTNHRVTNDHLRTVMSVTNSGPETLMF